VLSKRLGGRSGAVASLATLGWLPVIFLGLAIMREAIVTTHWLCGTGQMGAIMFSPVVILPILAGAALTATLAWRPRFDGLLWAIALGSFLSVAAGAGLGLSWIGRPDPDTYLRSLKVVQTLKPGDSFTLVHGTKVTYAETPALGAPPAPASAPQVDCTLEGVDGALEREVHCPTLTVRHDAKADLWIVEGASERPWAFLGSEKRTRDIWPIDVATSIAPPLGWTLGAVVGGLLQLGFLVKARRLRREGDELDGMEGVLQADGWVTLPGQPPLHVPGAAGLAEGPIWVRVKPGASHSYREAASATLEAWRLGTLEHARAALASREMTFVALSIATGLLCAAPLLLSGLGGSR
jgi:hypothetical protein